MMVSGSRGKAQPQGVTLFICAWIGVAAAESSAAVRYVDAGAAGANNGSSWANAYSGLQPALAASAAGDEIWVAAGIYRPAAPGGSRTATFQLKDGVAVYGGFPAGGGAFGDRDPEAFVTTLSGDLNANDGPNFANNGENVYHVVSTTNLDLETALDGFTITGGNATGTTIEVRRGAGVYSIDNDYVGSLAVRDCRVDANMAMFGGGGVFMNKGVVYLLGSSISGNVNNGVQVNFSSLTLAGCVIAGNTYDNGAGLLFSGDPVSAVITDCSFVGNAATNNGGAVWAASGNTVLNFRQCEFRNNIATNGGGGAVYAVPVSSAQFTECLFSGNSARQGGGVDVRPNNPSQFVNCDFRGNHATLQRGGGLYVETNASSKFVGCSFTGNTAALAGAGMSAPSCCSDPPSIVNCTFAGNSSGTTGGGLEAATPQTVISNCILWGNTASGASGQAAQLEVNSIAVQLNYSCVQGLTGSLGGAGNIGSDPLLVDADGADNAYGTDDDDARPAGGSPAIDAGKNALLPTDATDVDEDADLVEVLPLDLGGIPRVQDDAATPDTGVGGPPVVDMGAYELGQPLVVVNYVGGPGGSWFTPRNWSDGSVPDERTNVEIGAAVNVRAAGALAQDVTIQPGGALAVSAGSLVARSIVVKPGGSLTLSDPDALLDIHSLNLLPGASFSWSSGTLRLDQGGWTNAGAVSVGCGGDAQLILADGAVITAPSLQLCASGVLNGVGTVNANVTNGGVVAPGGPTGALVINGAYVQTAAGTLEIGLAGYAQDVDFGRLQVSGQFTRGGALVVAALPGFFGDVGGYQAIVSAASFTGAFSSTTIPSLPGGLHMTLQPSSAALKLFTMVDQPSSIVHVNASAAPGGDGHQWSTAIRNVQGALEIVNAFPGQVGEIWVAQGTYTPVARLNPLDELTATFSLPANVAIYGGFDGTETSLEERDPDANPTILSGDLHGDDGPNFTNRNDNVMHVVYGFGQSVTNTTVLDGFTIRGGSALSNVKGAGVFLSVASPSIRNCLITDNSSNGSGGGMYAVTAAVIENCRFVGNRSFIQGGGACFENNVSPTVRSCRFEGNTAPNGYGGGVLCVAEHSAFIDCDFINNTSGDQSQGGGGGYFAGEARVINCRFLGNHTRGPGGGARFYGDGGQPYIANCLFSGNTAGIGYPAGGLQDGGGLYCTPTASLTIANCVFSGNQAARFAGGLKAVAGSSSVAVVNCIALSNSDSGGMGEAAQVTTSGNVSVSYCDIQNWASGGMGNVSADPLLADADGADDAYGTDDDDASLTAGSPCIDAGNNAAVPIDALDIDADGFTDDPLPFALDGHLRFFDDPATVDAGAGLAPIVDKGCFEFGAPVDEPGAYVGPDGGDWFQAANWVGGAVPTSQTDVFIDRLVVARGDDARARNVVIRNGGSLRLDSGSLAADGVLVQAGSTLRLSDPSVSLAVTSLAVKPGATLQWDGGTIDLAGPLVSANALSIGCGGQAQLVLESGSSVSAPSVGVCSQGWLQGRGAIASSVTNAGKVSPGLSPGILTIAGGFAQSATGVLDIEVAGFSFGTQHDALIVTGAASLAGTLQVTALPGFAPSLDEATFLTAASVGGSFDALGFPTLTGGFHFILTSTSTSRSLFAEPAGPRLYVDASASPGGDASGWSSAARDLTDAVRAARLSDGAIEEIWVADGTYVPTEIAVPSDPLPARTATLILPKNLSLYGGFAGGETSLQERDPFVNITIISGDVNHDDGPNFANRSDNLYHVIKAASVDETTVLDGFTIRGGYAMNPGSTIKTGGGMECVDSSPIIRNCAFDSNFAQEAGGGVYCSNGSITVENCAFSMNATISSGTSKGMGAGIAVVDEGSALVTDSVFSGNVARSGGGIDLASGAGAGVIGCQFDGNRAGGAGGAIHCDHASIEAQQCDFTGNTDAAAETGLSLAGGGIAIEQGNGSITECVFTGNAAYTGGGLYVAGDIGSNVVVDDCLFNDNVADSVGGAVALDVGDTGVISIPFTGCVFSNNAANSKGGAVYAFDQFSSGAAPSFADCLFTGNAAGAALTPGEGGAYWGAVGVPTAVAGPRFADCAFENNSATSAGGAVRNQGCNLAFDGASFTGNGAPTGKSVFSAFRSFVSGRAVFDSPDELTATDDVAPGLSAPGSPTDVFTFHGTLRFLDRGPDYLDSPLLRVDIGGTAPGAQFDQIDAPDGHAVLTGGLFVNFINGFQPTLGQSFRIINSPDVAGRFGVGYFGAAPAGLLVTPVYDSFGLALVLEQVQTQIAFTDPVAKGLNATPVAAAIADFDNDGDPDMVVVLPAVPPSSNGTAVILYNGGVNGLGQWLGFTSTSPSMNVGGTPVAVTVGRFDNDAFYDFAVANKTGNTVTKFKNNGNGTFGSANIFITSPTGVAAGPISTAWDNLVVTRADGGVVIRSFTSTGGSVAATVTLTAGSSPAAPAVFDVNHDNFNDVVALNRGDVVTPASTICVFLKDAAGTTFLTPDVYPVGVGAADLAVGDLNGDGYKDLAATMGSDGAAAVLINAASGGVFDAAVNVPIGPSPTSIAMLDAEPDGDLDLAAIVLSAGQTVARLARNDLNDGQTVVFSQYNDLAAGEQPVLVRAADVNLDGVPDLITIGQVAGALAAGGAVNVRLNSEAPLCPADVSPVAGDGVVNIDDLFAVINTWGPCAAPCGTDIVPGGGNGLIDIDDLFAVINAWGNCP